MKNLNILIMAAGKGTRMVSNRAKVLHPVCGVPMLRFIYDAAALLQPEEIVVVIGHDADLVRTSLKGREARFVLQAEQRGTGHAVMVARDLLERMSGDLLVLYGDTPKINPDTLRKLVECHRGSGAATTLLTTRTEAPHGYGRILRDAGGRIEAIVEEKDATPEQRAITEINPGLYCFRIPPMLAALDRISDRNAQNEYYLTDIVAIQRETGGRIDALLHEDFDELQGINTRAELAGTSRTLRLRKNRELMAAGVSLIDPEHTYVDLDVVVEKDVTLHPMVTLQGTTRVAEGVTIHSGSRVLNSSIEADVTVLDCCLITDSHVGRGATIGPFARLRDGSSVGSHCRLGNFVELARSTLGDSSKAAHHAYLGDACIGRDVNIGAGVITCNYDGVRKHATIIEDGAFVGTDCQLVAPIRIGRGAYVAAGSCITQDVPPEALAIARERQSIKPDWAKRRRRATSENDKLP
jgi:bifunctional UDP-N-acetylglucosamine pyrophosphorylase / glucosamine-1-phosphate N-acetyltransferase